MSQLKIDSDGSLKLPLTVSSQLGDTSLETLSTSSSHLLLGSRGEDNSVLLSGLLGEISVPDLLSFFNMFRKTGVLHFELEEGDKALFFQQGEIVFATSTFADEDLGEILFSLGKVERGTLLDAYQQVQGNMTLGRLLVERKAVAPKDLWLAARSQVEIIVYNLFTAHQGGFHFQNRSFDQEQILRLSMSTQNLIMEGLRRLDEKALFMRKIISFEYYPLATGKEYSELAQNEARLLNASEAGQTTARDLFRKTGLSEFDGMRFLYALLEKGLVQMEDAPAIEIAGDLGEILGIYNNLLRMIFKRMKKATKEFPELVGRYLKELPQPYSFVLRDIELKPDGTLDGHHIVANLDGLEEGDKQKLLADSLCELVYMETMAVRRELDPEKAKLLIARVQETTARVRNLVGRAE